MSKQPDKESTTSKIATRLQPDKKERANFVINTITSAVLTGISAASGDVQSAVSSSVQTLSSLLGFPMGKRFAEAIILIAEDLDELSKKIEGFDMRNLQDNEVFTSIVLRACQIAIRTHQKEKIKLLSNAIQNCAIGNAPDEDLQLIFLDNIDSLTTWHIKILQYFRDPDDWYVKNNKQKVDYMMASASTGLENAFPELRDNKEFYSLIVKDLQAKGFINSGDFLNVSMSSSGVYASRINEIGRKFLKFVTSPIE
ncbi:MAG TPA: hypothetical protein VFJ23_07395 [Candidatus Nitrosotalea sp.]|nr:hypothetical protein [Candidatus Nitrosotalea sp.]